MLDDKSVFGLLVKETLALKKEFAIPRWLTFINSIIHPQYYYLGITCLIAKLLDWLIDSVISSYSTVNNETFSNFKMKGSSYLYEVYFLCAFFLFQINILYPTSLLPFLTFISWTLIVFTIIFSYFTFFFFS